MDADDADRLKSAIGRLTGQQRELVGRCLLALVEGPYIDDDDEFRTVMGASREETAEVAVSWPDISTHGSAFLIVNNTLNNLLGYPHGQWRKLSTVIRAAEADVARMLICWRDEDHCDGSGKAYFDAMM